MTLWGTRLHSKPFLMLLLLLLLLKSCTAYGWSKHL